ncbi:MAG: hypothetical protein HC824_09070 [Synechococcales cyanobacterium RM1_1_8]|nr:hypothetical protein [Synechococcales cyanobacterium RM1_1_8]
MKRRTTLTAALGLMSAIACSFSATMADAQSLAPPSLAQTITEPAIYIPTEQERTCDRLIQELGESSPNRA